MSAITNQLFKLESRNFQQLLNLDKRSYLFIGICLSLYFVLSFAKIHTSSIAIWDQIFGVQKPKSLIIGSPKGIRQDEWMVGTTMILAHNALGRPISNIGFGAENTPVITGLPFKDFTMILRPNLWFYFIFDIERGFAFNWNFGIFFFLISIFLLFMIFTKNNFWISLFGTTLIFISSAMQWWSYYIGNNMIFPSLATIAFICLLYADNNKKIILSSILLILGLFNLFVTIYPAWQIPLIYLYIFCLIGFLINNWNKEIIFNKLPLKLIGVFTVLIVVCFSLWHHFELALKTYEILANTAYPGKRFSMGGDLVSGKLFSDFYVMFLSESKYPSAWFNVSESSNFIMFFPIIFYVIIYDFIKWKKIDWMQLLISLYILILLVWMFLGFNEFLSKATLLSMSPPQRTLPIVGVANIILLIVYLSKKQIKEKINNIELVLVLISTILFFKIITWDISKATSRYFTSGQTLLVCIIFTVIYILIRYKDFKYSLLGISILLLYVNFNNLKVNPLTIGLSALTDNPIVKSTSSIAKLDPEARWVVFGNHMMTNLLRVNGIKSLNGVKNVPILADMEILDPSKKDSFIYNRLAHINVSSFIDYKDSVIFKLNTSATPGNENKDDGVEDNFSIFMDPCSPRLKQLGIKYIAFTYQPQPAEVRCMTLENTENSQILIYKFND